VWKIYDIIIVIDIGIKLLLVVCGEKVDPLWVCVCEWCEWTITITFFAMFVYYLFRKNLAGLIRNLFSNFDRALVATMYKTTYY